MFSESSKLKALSLAFLGTFFGYLWLYIPIVGFIGLYVWSLASIIISESDPAKALKVSLIVGLVFGPLAFIINFTSFLYPLIILIVDYKNFEVIYESDPLMAFGAVVMTGILQLGLIFISLFLGVSLLTPFT